MPSLLYRRMTTRSQSRSQSHTSLPKERSPAAQKKTHTPSRKKPLLASNMSRADFVAKLVALLKVASKKQVPQSVFFDVNHGAFQLRSEGGLGRGKTSTYTIGFDPSHRSATLLKNDEDGTPLDALGFAAFESMSENHLTEELMDLLEEVM